MVLIYQSYRTSDVPEWIRTCMQSVKKWAAGASYDYRFIDDELFCYAPDWYREKVGHNIQLVSDLARLELARKFLAEGYERVVWIDADMLVFDPSAFVIDEHSSFSFCKETWLDEDPERNIIHQEKVNNSVAVFGKDNSFLDFYIDACQQMVKGRADEDLEPVTVGTAFLTALNDAYPLPLMQNVGIMSPALIYGILNHHQPFLDQYLVRHGSPVHAVNLCGSKDGEYFRDMKISSNLLSQVVSHLTKFRSLHSEEMTQA